MGDVRSSIIFFKSSMFWVPPGAPWVHRILILSSKERGAPRERPWSLINIKKQKRRPGAPAPLSPCWGSQAVALRTLMGSRGSAADLLICGDTILKGWSSSGVHPPPNHSHPNNIDGCPCSHGGLSNAWGPTLAPPFSTLKHLASLEPGPASQPAYTTTIRQLYNNLYNNLYNLQIRPLVPRLSPSKSHF